MPPYRFLIRGFLSVSILSLVLYTTDVSEIAAILTGANMTYLFAGIGLYILGDAISAKKLQILLNVRGSTFLPIWRYYYVGKLFNSLLPTTIGGDAVKAQKIRRHFDDFNAYSGVFMERFTGLIALTAIAATTAAVFHDRIPIMIHLLLYGVFLPGVIIASALLWSNRLSRITKTVIPRIPGSHIHDVGDRIVKFLDTVEQYKYEQQTVVIALAVSLVFHVLVITVNIAFATAVGMTISPLYFFVFIPVAAVILFLPISIGGFGVREAVYLSFFIQVGATPAAAVALALLVNAMVVLSAGIGAVAYLWE